MSHRSPLHDTRHHRCRRRSGLSTVGGMCSRVDTRSKILTLEEAERLPGPLTLVTGYFDILRAEHARELQQVRDRTPGGVVLVAILTCPDETIEIGARAELVAALRMLD